MKFKTNMWLQFLGVGIQSANFISGALPPKAQAGVSIAVGIAQAIVEQRRTHPIRTSGELAELIHRVVPSAPHGQRERIDPATRTFQALRIAVNDELGALERLLAQLPRCVKPGGRVAIISFHSLEDRRVKHAFRDKAVWQPLTKKPVTAGEDETRRNPRARSAKLRAARRVG